VTITQGRLTAKRVEREKKPGRYLDGRGLILEVREGTHGLAKSWTLRYALHGRTRWLGLGSAFDVGLKQARAKAAQARELIAAGDLTRSTRNANWRPPRRQQCPIAAPRSRWSPRTTSL